MAVTPAAFKISFPEFSTLSDAEIQRFIDEASACVSVSAWSARADTGISYLTAHLLSEFGTGATGGVFGFGAVKSKRIDKTAVSFDYGKAGGGHHSSTKYGRHFDSLKAKVFADRCL